MSTDSEQKRLCAERAVELFVKSDTIIGLGTGSTANFIVARIAEKLKSGELTNVVGVPTSEATAAEARRCGVPLLELDELADRRLHVCLDGADEFASGPLGYDVIKGLGGALFREKQVALEADHYVIMVLANKEVNELGRCGVPCEVLPFGWKRTARRIQEHPALKDIVGSCDLRTNADGSPYVTDNGNYILLLRLKNDRTLPVTQHDKVAEALKGICGVLEHGLFLNFNPSIVVGHENVKKRRS